MVYNACVTTTTTSLNYNGSTELEFKKRWYNHKVSFNNIEKRSETKLSQYIWDLREEDSTVEPDIKWTIHKLCSPYRCGSRKCDLCLSEKLAILKSDPRKTLNKKSEIMNKCRHNSKFKVKYIIIDLLNFNFVNMHIAFMEFQALAQHAYYHFT